MGKLTGFIEYQRLEEAAEAPRARTKHWGEFIAHLADGEAAVQAARCMDCGIPFCNQGCPVNNIIPDFNDLVYRQDWKTALDVLHITSEGEPGVRRQRRQDPVHDRASTHQRQHPVPFGLLPPEVVHYGQAQDAYDARAQVLATAYAAHPERFVRQAPRPPQLPTAAWINPPSTTSDVPPTPSEEVHQ